MRSAPLLSSLLLAICGTSRLFALLRGCIVVAFLSFASSAFAEGIGVRQASIDVAEDGWQLQGDFDIQFSPRLEEAVNRGVPLYFAFECEISRPRSYWLGGNPRAPSQPYKLSLSA